MDDEISALGEAFQILFHCEVLKVTAFSCFSYNDLLLIKWNVCVL